MSEIIRLDINTDSIKYLCTKDKRLAKVISMVGTITYEPYKDSYRFLIKTIIGQMLSNKVADIISERLEVLCNGTINPNIISNLSNDDIRSIGISKSKVSYIRNLTEEIKSGNIDLSEFPCLPDKEIINKLTSIRGIGHWTAKMYLLFVLDRQDILPYEDIAFLQGYKWVYKTDNYTPAAVSAKCKKWKPYSSIAARYLYRALDSGLTKEGFHLYK